MSINTFRDLEHAGWLERASSYEVIAPVTRQAIGPILASFGDVRDLALLEVASGPGHLSGEAAGLGADVHGVDFAKTMVDLAQSHYPSVKFSEGDAENLRFENQQFDGVICAFGLLHLQNPDRAIEEAFRVLRKGGRDTYTVWCTPENGGEFFGFLMGAIQTHGNLDLDLPVAPPFYRFADPDEIEAALTAAGFSRYEIDTIPVVWRGEQAQDAVDVIYKATVRTKSILEAQTEDARAAIHEAILSGVEAFRVDDHFEIALPALMVSALKPK